MHWPALINAYSVASESQQETIRLLFTTVAMSAQSDQYGVEMVPGGIWFLGMGSVLRLEVDRECKALGILALIIGACMLYMYVVYAVGTFIKTSAATAVYLYTTPF